MNVKKIARLWLLNKKNFVKESTLSAYALLVANHIDPYFGKKDSIEEKDIQKFVLKRLNDGLSQKSVKDIIVVLKMIYKFGVKSKYFDYQEFDIKYPVNMERKEIEVMSKANEKKLINYLTNHYSYKNLGILICIFTGIRIGEICALRWEDIDLKNKVISIKRTIERIYVIKGNKRFTKVIESNPKTIQSNRDIPISSMLLSALNEMFNYSKIGNYVISNNDKPIEPRTYRNYYNGVLKRLNINKLKFHGLRHSFATRCIEAKCDYKTVSALLGHSNITTTLNLYVHPDNEEKRKCIERMIKYVN